MIAIIIFFTVLFILLLEYFSRRDDLRHPHVSFDIDTTLVEPGEVITLYYSVHNTSRLPLLYVGFSLRLEPEVVLHEDEEWRRLHVTTDFTGTRVDHHFYLLPRRKFSGKVHISLKKRGLQDLGRFHIETGDFLGLHPVMSSGDIGTKVICTSDKSGPGELEVLGGELGDVSVRRFILDDPTMLLGYREYTGREPMKQISWKQSAKAGKLMVRQNDYTTDRVAVVIVNMDSSQRPIMEHCLKLTRAVCERLEEEKIPYELMSNGDLFSLPEGIGRGHLFFILRRLGLSRPTGYTTLSQLMERCDRRRRSNCSYIIITPPVGDEGQAALERFRRRVDSRPVILYADAK
jgi:uncharacterized protein (DUF58 family)